MSRLFGGVIRHGEVMHDIEAAMRHWMDVLGVGPWLYIDHVPVADFQSKGQPSPVDVSIALAHAGTLHIELIQQRHDAPSLSRDVLQAGPEGLHHLGSGTRDCDADLARAGDGLYRWPCGKRQWPRSLRLPANRRTPGHHRRTVRHASRTGSCLCGDRRGGARLGRAGPDADDPAHRVRGGEPARPGTHAW